MKYLLFLLLPALLLGCSSGEKKGHPSVKDGGEPVVQYDPYSATLHPAKQRAQARDFEAERVNGETFRLSDQRGKVVLLNIWATWCSPCVEEMPDFVRLYDEYKDKGLVILGVSIDEKGRDVVVPFLEKHKINYPVIIDDGRVMDKYGPTMGIPTTYIIDKEGKMRYFAVGPLTSKELKPRIERLLAEE